MKTISEIAKELKVDRHTVYQMISRNNIQADDVGKNRVQLFDTEKENIIKKFFEDKSDEISQDILRQLRNYNKN